MYTALENNLLHDKKWSFYKEHRHFRPWVPNLSLTMYPFSISTGKYVPLQHFDGCTCTPKISCDNTFYHGYLLIYLTTSI